MRYLFPRHNRSGRYCGFHSLSSLLLQNRSAFLPGVNVRCPFPASNGSILLIGKTAGIFNAWHPPVLKQEHSEVRTVEPDHLIVMESIKSISYLAQVSMYELHSHCPLANT